jgi:hypothetical protein
MEILLGYLIIGAIFALVVWWAVFQDDYDSFIKQEYQVLPPTTKQKWRGIIGVVFFWPAIVFWMFVG